MAERDLSEILDDCITRLASGQNIDDCLLHYADHASDLRPMLEAGLLIRRISINPLEARQAKDRVRFRLESQRRPSRNRQIWTASSALLAALVAILVGTIFFAERSLPGEPLYGLKRFSETVRLVAGAGNEAVLQEQFAQRRRDEVAQLLALRRAADVTFTGELQAVNSSNWRVSGLMLIVAPSVPGAQAVQVGDQLEVQASTTLEGTARVRSLSLLQRGKPNDSTPLPTSSPAFTDTAEPTATPTTMPSLTPIPSATLTPTLTLLPTLKTTLAPTNTTRPTTGPGAKTTIATSPPPVPTRTGNQGPGGSGGSSGSGSSGNSGSGSGSSGGSGGSNDDHEDDGSDNSGDSEDSGSDSDDHGGDD